MRYSHQLSILTQADEVPDDEEQSPSNNQASSSSQPQNMGHSAPLRHNRKAVDDEVPDNQASSDSSTNSSLLAALPKTQQKLLVEIRDFGRIPKCNTGKSRKDRYEYNLYMRYWRSKDSLPEDFLLLQDQAGALTRAQQNLVDEIKSLGHVPNRKKGSSPDDQRENRLAKRFYEQKDDKRFYDHLLEELQQLQADKADEVQEDKADALCL